MKKVQYILLIIVSLIQTSCFEIIEDITLKKDGSGSMQYTLNFSQSMTKIKSLLIMDEVEGYKIPTERKIQFEFDKIVAVSKRVEGIFNVTNFADMDNYIFTYSCDFSSVENLNTLVDSIRSFKSNKNFKDGKYFNYSKGDKTFVRFDNTAIKDFYQKLSDSEKTIFNGSVYTCVYKFENEIDSLSNNNAKLSLSKKAVLLKLEILEVLNSHSTIKNQIQLK